MQHALAIPDVELAARLIEPMALAVAFQGQLYTVLGWLNALPEALVHARPFLCVCHALLLMHTNQLEMAQARLQAAERGVQKEISASQAQIILGWVLVLRGRIANYSGDIPQAISLARQALDLLPEAEVIPRAGAMMTMIRAYQVSGDVTPASEHAVAATVALIRAWGELIATVISITQLARLYVLQGRLRLAAATYEQVAQVFSRLEVLQTGFSSPYYFGLGDLLRECNELEAAERYLAQGMALVNETLALEPWVAMLGYTALARLQQARGKTREAFATLDGLVQIAEQRHFPPDLMTQEAAVQAQLELAQGNVAAAIHWADASGLSAMDDDLPYPREGVYLALARVRIAQARDDPAAPFLQDVLHLLDRLLRDAQAKARMNSVLEILLLRALALEAQGNRTWALSTLERALVLAATRGLHPSFCRRGRTDAGLTAPGSCTQQRSGLRGYPALRLWGAARLRSSSLLCSP